MKAIPVQQNLKAGEKPLEEKKSQQQALPPFIANNGKLK